MATQENLLSVIVMRHPMERLLAGDAWLLKNFGPEESRTAAQWWEIANSEHTNNYALKALSPYTCCNGEHTEVKHLEGAKDLLRRLTFVLDLTCLDESMQALANTLGLPYDGTTGKGWHHLHNRTPRQRLGMMPVFLSADESVACSKNLT